MMIKSKAAGCIRSWAMILACSPWVLASAEAAPGKQGSSKFPVVSVQISPSQAQIEIGKSLDLTAGAFDRRGKRVSGCAFSFSTSDGSVASVSSQGRVLGLSLGSATILAACNGVSGSASIRVVSSAPSPSPTPTLTASPSPTPTVTVTPSPTPTATVSPSPTPTVTATPSPLPSPSPAPSGSPTHPDLKGSAALDAEELIFVQLINDYRAANGIGPLKVSVDLTIATDWMSTDMSSKNYFSHTDSLGRSPFQRMIDFGYTFSTTKGENIAAGNATASGTFTQWKNSPGHNANMLNGNFRVMGISRVYSGSSSYRWYWTNKFGGYVDETVPGL